MRLFLDPAVIEKPAAAPAAPPAPAAAAAPPPAAAAPAPAAAAAAPAAAAPAETKTVSAAWTTPAAAKPEDKPAATAPAADPAKPAATPKPEEKFDLKAPEGMTVEPAALEGYKTLAKELGLTSEQAQKLLERDLGAQKDANANAQQQIRKQSDVWAGEIRTKWGEKYAEREATVSRAFDYADPKGEFRAKLNAAGLLYNPDLVEFVERFGNLFKEDKIPSGAQTPPKAKDNRPQHDRLKDAFRELNKQADKQKG